jgi:hypothetical protein
VNREFWGDLEMHRGEVVAVLMLTEFAAQTTMLK